MFSTDCAQAVDARALCHDQLDWRRALAKERTPFYTSGRMELSHTKTAQEVLDHFGVDTEVGLTEERATKELKKYGPNGKATVAPQMCVLVCVCVSLLVCMYR